MNQMTMPTDGYMTYWTDLTKCPIDWFLLNIVWLNVIMQSCDCPYNFYLYNFQGTVEDRTCEQCTVIARSIGSTETEFRKTRHNDVRTFNFNDTVTETRCLIVTLPIFIGNRPVNVTVRNFDCNDIRVTQRQETEQVRWRVVAVVCHTGTTSNSGHFWAWRRVPDSVDKFVCINDSTVTGDTVEYDDFGKIPDAFMLFLEPAETN